MVVVDPDLVLGRLDHPRHALGEGQSAMPSPTLLEEPRRHDAPADTPLGCGEGGRLEVLDIAVDSIQQIERSLGGDTGPQSLIVGFEKRRDLFGECLEPVFPLQQFLGQRLHADFRNLPLAEFGSTLPM